MKAAGANASLHALLRENYSERDLDAHPEILAYALAVNGLRDSDAAVAGRVREVPMASVPDIVDLVTRRSAYFAPYLAAAKRGQAIGEAAPPIDAPLRRISGAQTTHWTAGAKRASVEVVRGGHSDGGRTASWSLDDLTLRARDGGRTHLIPSAATRVATLKSEFDASDADWDATRRVRPLGQRGRSAADPLFLISAEVTERTNDRVSSYVRTFDLHAAASPDAEVEAVHLGRLVSNERIRRFTRAIVQALDVPDDRLGEVVQAIHQNFSIGGNTLTIHLPSGVAGDASAFVFDLTHDPKFIHVQANGLSRDRQAALRSAVPTLEAGVARVANLARSHRVDEVMSSEPLSLARFDALLQEVASSLSIELVPRHAERVLRGALEAAIERLVPDEREDAGRRLEAELYTARSEAERRVVAMSVAALREMADQRPSTGALVDVDLSSLRVAQGDDGFYLAANDRAGHPVEARSAAAAAIRQALHRTGRRFEVKVGAARA